MVKVIVAGTRTVTDAALVAAVLERAQAVWGERITEVIHGGAAGVDELAMRWADAHGIPSTEYVALWRTEGRSAGPKRNTRMLRESGATHVCVIWTGDRATSPGSSDLLRKADAARKIVYEHIIGQTPLDI